VSPAWWAAFGPAEAQLRCGDGQHRLRWADGTLEAVDHPDAEGELVLGALGGDTSPCLDVVAAWGKHCDDLAVLAIGPRSVSDQLTIPASVLDEIAAASSSRQAYHGLGNPAAQAISVGGTISWHSPAAHLSTVIYASQSGRSGRVAGQRAFRDRDWIRQVLARLRAYSSDQALRQRRIRELRVVASRLARPARFPRAHGWSGFLPAARHSHLLGGWGVPEVDEGRAELIRLLALGPPFQFRLSAAVAHAWSAHGANAGRAERARPALTAALAGRLAPAAKDWLDIDPAQVELSLHDGAGWGELALIENGGTGRLQARLPVGWLASVWAPGFAVVDGHLVVSVLEAAWPAARVLAVRTPGRDPAERIIRNDQGHWSVTSR
jgi:hypothetical protein